MSGSHYKHASLSRRGLGMLALFAPFLVRAKAIAANCLPLGITSAPPLPSTPTPSSRRVPAASVFLDVSGSMAGYVARPAQARGVRASAPDEPRPFRDIVLSLPELAASVADTTKLFAFGTAIRPLALRELPRAGEPRFYADQDSHIQDALAQMDALPEDEIGLLMTDLFLSGEEVFAGAASMRSSLAHMLDSGRSIALLGVRSGFSGPIYDIPGQKPYTGATERPFYLLICGPLPAIEAILQRLRTELLEPLPPTRDGLPRDHVVVFTHAPLRDGIRPLSVTPEGKAEAAPMLVPELGDGVVRLRFPRGAGTATAPLDLHKLAWPDALLPNRFVVAEQLWALPPDNAHAACSGRWIAIHSLTDLAQLTGDTLSIGGPTLARATPNLIFLLHAQIVAAGLGAAPAQTAWTRDWNLEAREAQDFVAQRPTMFRTLNLKEIVGMLEGIVRDGLTPRPIGEVLIVFQVPPR